MARHGVGHRGDDLFEGLIIGDEFQDLLPVLLEPFGFVSDACGCLGPRQFLLRLRHFFPFFRDVDHRAARPRWRGLVRLKTPAAAHPVDGAARQHQSKLVLDGPGARIDRIYRIPQSLAILRMDHGVEFRPGELKLGHRAFHHLGQSCRKRHDVLLEVAFPDAESRHRLGQIQPLNRLAQMHLRPDAFDCVARKLGGDACHSQLFGSGGRYLPAIDRECSQYRVAGIANRLTPARAQTVTQDKIARSGKSVVGRDVVDDDRFIAKGRRTAGANLGTYFETVDRLKVGRWQTRTRRDR